MKTIDLDQEVKTLVHKLKTPVRSGITPRENMSAGFEDEYTYHHWVRFRTSLYCSNAISNIHLKPPGGAMHILRNTDFIVMPNSRCKT